jgi:hypothetical protein
MPASRSNDPFVLTVYVEDTVYAIEATDAKTWGWVLAQVIEEHDHRQRLIGLYIDSPVRLKLTGLHLR